MKKRILFFTLLFLSVLFLTGCIVEEVKTDNTLNSNLSTTPNMSTDVSSRNNKYSVAPTVLPVAERSNKKSILNTDKGVIEIKLFGDEAPIAVSNFIFLIKDKYYDGIVFHRREEGFVIQGGDPLGKGTGGPGYKFADEPIKRKYNRGIVAMANSGPNTNGSQFFIMLANRTDLGPNYTIFGEVTKGMDVVDKIQIGDKIITATIANL